MKARRTHWLPGWRNTEILKWLKSQPPKIFKKTREIYMTHSPSWAFFSCSSLCLTSLPILHSTSTLLLLPPSLQHLLLSIHGHLVAQALPSDQNHETFVELVVFQKVGREFVLHSDGINFPMWEKCQSLVTVSDAKQPEWVQEAV